MGIISQIGPSEKPPTEHLQVTAQKLLKQDPGKIHPKGNSTCLTILLYTRKHVKLFHSFIFRSMSLNSVMGFTMAVCEIFVLNYYS